MTNEQITTAHLDVALKSVAMHANGKYSIVDVFNKAQEMVEAQAQPHDLITVEEARKLGSGNAQFQLHTGEWKKCESLFHHEFSPLDGRKIKYRALKPIQPEPVDLPDKIEADKPEPVQPSPTPVSHSQIAYEMALALVDHLAVQPAKPVQPKERQPLSVLEVEQILNQHDYDVHGDRARYIVRMTEAAHGIGEKI